MCSRNKNEGSATGVHKLENSIDKVREKQGTRFCGVFLKLGEEAVSVWCRGKVRSDQCLAILVSEVLKTDRSKEMLKPANWLIISVIHYN